MKNNLQSKNIKLTSDIKNYILNDTVNLFKLLKNLEENKKNNMEITSCFNLIKTTHHHKEGKIFQADCSINIGGRKFYSSSTQENLYKAIDEVKSDIFREIRKSNHKKLTLYKRGATSIKKMLKGISKRNPITAKYDNKKDKNASSLRNSK